MLFIIIHYCSLLFNTAHYYSLLLITIQYCSLLFVTTHYYSLLLITIHYLVFIIIVLLVPLARGLGRRSKNVRARPSSVRSPQLICIHIHQLFRIQYTLCSLDTVTFIGGGVIINLCRVRRLCTSAGSTRAEHT